MQFLGFGLGHIGWLIVIVGPMFSGKSDEAIRLGHLAKIAKQNVIAFKHAIDQRYHPTDLASHSGARLPGFAVSTVAEMDELITANTKWIVIDEGQFLGPEIVEFVRRHRKAGRRIVISGLNMDYKGEPFGPMPTLMAIANEVHTMMAVCTICNGPASFSQRFLQPDVPTGALGSETQVVVGADKLYAARCERDWVPWEILREAHPDS